MSGEDCPGGQSPFRHYPKLFVDLLLQCTALFSIIM